MDVKKIDFEELKKMAKALNQATYDAGDEEASFLEKKLKIIGVTKEKLAADFDAAIQGIDDDATSLLPDEIIDFYNANFSDEGEEGGEEGGEEAPPEKKKAATKVAPEKKAAEKKPAEKKKTAPKELSCFGHKKGTQAAAIDELINTGKKISLDDLAKKSGRSPLGVKGHIKHLQVDRKLKIEEKDGVYVLVKK
jgi:hypothetical protein